MTKLSLSQDFSLSSPPPVARTTWSRARPPGWYELDRAEPLPADTTIFVNAEGRVFTTDDPVAQIAPLEGMMPASEIGSALDHPDDTRANLIFGEDTRNPWTAASDLTSFNKRTIGRLLIAGDVTGSKQCTGTLVGSRHVLTSAHCLLNDYYQQFPQGNNITFAPGHRGWNHNPQDPNGDPRHSIGFYTRTSTDTYDYALVILRDEAITANLGYMGMQWSPSDSWYEGMTITTIGYPGEMQQCARSPLANGACGGYMYSTRCEIDDAGTDLEFECDATSGQSGSAIYPSGVTSVIGVLRGSESGINSYNKAVRLTGSKVNDLCSWINSFPSAYSSPHWCSQ